MNRWTEISWNKWGPAVLVSAAALLLALATQRLRGLFLNTTLLTCAVLAIAVPWGVILGLAVGKLRIPGRRALAWLFVGLLFVPLYVQAGAWQSLLGLGGWLADFRSTRDGYANPWLAGWRGAIWVHAAAAVPWVALAVAAAVGAVERQIEERALLDASPLRVLVMVSLRRAWGGVAAAGAWIAATCATEITVTDLFQVRTFAEEVYTDAGLGILVGAPGGGAGAAPGAALPSEPFIPRDLVLGVAALALVLVAAAWFAAPWLSATATMGTDVGWKWRPRRPWIAAALIWTLASVVAILPLSGLAWKAGQEFHRQGESYTRSWSFVKLLDMVARSPWEHRREWGWSLAIGALAAVFATTIAVAAAWFVRNRPTAGAALAGMVALVAALPGPLLAVWLIAAINRPPNSPLAGLTVIYDRTLAAPILLEAVRALPLVTLLAWTQLASVPVNLLDAAHLEGAGKWAQFWRIALPVRRVGVAVAGIAALAIAVGELSATILVLPPGVTTISVRIFQLLHYGVDDRVAALCLAIFGFIALAIFAARTGTAIIDRRRRVSPPPSR